MAVAYPRRTERLVLRLMRAGDAQALAGYRNDPVVARHQLWELPYPVERAAASLAEQDGWDDIVAGQWTTLAIELDGRVVGDVVTNVDATSGVAEIGYTLARPFQGQGYATEAAGALVHDLVERIGVGRIYGELDPENVASQRVLENLGLQFEVVTRKSFLWRGVWSDNMSYGATAEEYRAWRDRPTGTPTLVRLVPLTSDNSRLYGALATHHSQERFVAPMSQSYADALFPEAVNGVPLVPRLSGIEVEGEPAGFVMIAEASAAHPEPFLWRLLVDRTQQRRGIGRAALDLLVATLRQEGHRTLLTSWREASGGPAPFYLGYGFTVTGARDDGEVGARLVLR